MKKSLIALILITTLCATASAQFFTAEERGIDKKSELKSSLPEAEQRAIYRSVCEKRNIAHSKATGMNPIKLHYTPEQRKEAREKALKSEKSLLKLYRKEIAKQHQITITYLHEIESRGDHNKWLAAKTN